MRLGHNPITIDQPSYYPVRRFNYFLVDSKEYIKNLIRYFLKKKTHTIPSRQVPYKEKCGLSLKSFIDSYIIHTKKIIEDEDFIEICGDYDIKAIVVGSDQVWRPKYNLKIQNSFCGFIGDRDIIRISYAASFGTNNWEYSKCQTRSCKKLIEKFNAVSVREKTGVDLCKKYFNVDAYIVLDPVFLIDRNEYETIVKNNKDLPSYGDLFCYVLDLTDEKIKAIDIIARKYNLVPYTVFSTGVSDNDDLDKNVHPSMERWLKCFIDAKYVICDSFHATAFSIIFQKNFIILSNKERGATRFETLLDTFNINHEVLADVNDKGNLFFIENDWDSISCLIEKYRKISINYLKTNLSCDGY